MNIDGFHNALLARDILDVSPLIKKAFNDGDDGKMKRLSLLFYNSKSLSSLYVPGHKFIQKNGSSFRFYDDEDYIMNFMKSTFQVHCGKIDGKLLFLDFCNESRILVEEESLDDYVNALFTRETVHELIDNDFIPFRDLVRRYSNVEEFDEYSLERV
jgi:hypothetical protein